MPKGSRKNLARPHHFIEAFLALLILYTAPLPALAQVSVAVLEIDFVEEFPHQTLEEVKGALAAGLRPIASRVIFPPEVQEPACDQPECVTEATHAVGAHTVLRARLSLIGQNYEIETELSLAHDGSTLGSISLNCEVCSWTEALDMIRHASEGLRPSLPGLVAVAVNPEQAAIAINGIPYEAPEPICLPPGNHVVEATLEEHTSQSREITIIAGALSEVTLSLAPMQAIHRLDPDPDPHRYPDSPPIPQRSRRDRVLGISGGSSIGAGALSLAAGIYWLTLEGMCARNTEYRGDTCVDVYFTWPQGLAFAVAGVGLVSAGIALLLIRRRERRATSRAQPLFNLSVGEDGMSFGVLGNF